MARMVLRGKHGPKKGGRASTRAFTKCVANLVDADCQSDYQGFIERIPSPMKPSKYKVNNALKTLEL